MAREPPTAASDPSDDAGQPVPPASSVARTPTAAGLKVAFIGDQGVGSDARRVLQLIAAEHADALIHLGDFAYDEAAPTAWDDQITSVLGARFPLFAAIGNHDVGAWTGQSGFQRRLVERLNGVPEAQCIGGYGVNATCSFRGLVFVLSGVGTYGTDHESYLESALAGSDAVFRLCIWHKNQHDMQVGSKADEVGWEAYRTCARYGAPVITGHEHSYARSLVLTAIGDREQGHGAIGEPAQLLLEPGRTFVAVSGLGGESSRARTSDHGSDTWWASIYARRYQLQDGMMQGTQSSIQYGALFIEFGVDGDPELAQGYFKTVDGQLRDEFTLRSSARAAVPANMP